VSEKFFETGVVSWERTSLPISTRSYLCTWVKRDEGRGTRDERREKREERREKREERREKREEKLEEGRESEKNIIENS
jgi:hypothetical protein